MQTKLDQQLEEAEARHEDDPVRAANLRLTRRFKASWLELAEALTECRRKNNWKRWGYSSFEDYAKKELHLRADTVAKLTGSFSFLKSKAPDVLARDPLTESMPTYQAVDYLRRVHERSEESGKPEVFDAVYNKVVDEGAPLQKVRREFEPVLFPRSEDEQQRRDQLALRSLSTRLRDLCQGSRALRPQTQRALEAALEAALSELPEPKRSSQEDDVAA